MTSVFNSRGQHTKAVEIGNRLIASRSVQFVHGDDALFYDTWRYFSQQADKSYSLTDCISFVLTERLGIRTAFAFDRHFVQAGFEKIP